MTDMGAKKAGAKRARRKEREPTEGPDARADFFDTAEGETSHLAVTTDAGRFLVATSDRGVGRSLYVKRSRPEFRVLRRVVSVLETVLGEGAVKDRSFIDVGANIGTTTVCALVAHGFGSAVACEPEAENHQLLRANLALNDLEDRAEALEVAVSSRSGRSSFVVVERRKGASWVALDPGKIEAAEAVRAKRLAEDPTARDDPRPRKPAEVSEMTVVDVELVTLDQLATRGLIDLERAGLLWIDAEGHEGHVLAGAGTLADRGVPTVVEFHPSGLDNRGDREGIEAIAEQCYTHFVDVRRRGADRDEPRRHLRSVSELHRYADRFLDPSSPVAFTDLLLLRLDPAQADAWTTADGA
jgi:FkbM family methyltransferase